MVIFITLWGFFSRKIEFYGEKEWFLAQSGIYTFKSGANHISIRFIWWDIVEWSIYFCLGSLLKDVPIYIRKSSWWKPGVNQDQVDILDQDHLGRWYTKYGHGSASFDENIGKKQFRVLGPDKTSDAKAVNGTFKRINHTGKPYVPATSDKGTYDYDIVYTLLGIKTLNWTSMSWSVLLTSKTRRNLDIIPKNTISKEK